MNPFVSVIIPVYNGADYLGEAIDSALAQTYSDMEIIVVNDGSSDDGATGRLAQSYGDRIRYFEKENGGVSSALNRGIREARGEYVSWLSHDDIYTPDKISRQIALLQACSENAMCFCSLRQINAQAEFISDKKDMQLEDGAVLSPREALAYSILHTINGCTMLVPKAALVACGGFNEDMRYCQDILMWWRILLGGCSLVFSDTADVYSRVHPAQQTGHAMEIYHRDAARIAVETAPAFARLSDRQSNLLLLYAKGEAVHANRESLQLCFNAAKEKKLFSPLDKLRLRLTLFYGTALRPVMRRMYYRFFKRTKA